MKKDIDIIPKLNLTSITNKTKKVLQKSEMNKTRKKEKTLTNKALALPH
jgi:hypothetical protein